MRKGSEADMADLYSTLGVGEQDSSSEPGKTRFGKALNLFGAAASLALIAGIGLWGYKLVLRDVSGVPVGARPGWANAGTAG